MNDNCFAIKECRIDPGRSEFSHYLFRIAGIVVTGILMVTILQTRSYASGISSQGLNGNLHSHENSDIQESRNTEKENIFLTTSLQNLFTTHLTNFTGGNFLAGIRLSRAFWIGAGVELSHCNLHKDNGWKLTELNFRPAYLDLKFEFPANHRFIPYVETAPGISFNHYDKVPQHYPAPVDEVSEKGVYLYTGAGISYRLTKNIASSLEAGFKGYNFSFNNLDVNPHGFDLRFGLVYYFSSAGGDK